VHASDTSRDTIARQAAAVRDDPRRRARLRDVEKPKSVEAYFAGLSDDAQSALRSLRDAIAAAAPEAEDAIVYSMPGFRLHGKGFVGYAAFKDHYSFFPMSVAAIEAHRDELGEHVTGKGTISFEYGERLPAGVVKKVVKTRLAEVADRFR
jgi:uncharacterized protein YdhG (YjbR/CyaY superfamily)